MGGKPEPRSTQKAMEKRCKKEEPRDCQKSRNKNPQPRHPPRVLGPGEGVGGGDPSPREEGKGMTPVQRAKPPQPRGLVGLDYFVKENVLLSSIYFLCLEYCFDKLE